MARTHKKEKRKLLGLFDADELPFGKGKCPQCGSSNIVDYLVCEGCGVKETECKDCGSAWQEWIV